MLVARSRTEHGLRQRRDRRVRGDRRGRRRRGALVTSTYVSGGEVNGELRRRRVLDGRVGARSGRRDRAPGELDPPEDGGLGQLGVDAGGVLIYESPSTVDLSADIRYNSATGGRGGGVEVVGEWGFTPIDASGATNRGNWAADGGGGVYLTGVCRPTAGGLEREAIQGTRPPRRRASWAARLAHRQRRGLLRGLRVAGGRRAGRRGRDPGGPRDPRRRYCWSGQLLLPLRGRRLACSVRDGSGTPPSPRTTLRRAEGCP